MSITGNGFSIRVEWSFGAEIEKSFAPCICFTFPHPKNPGNTTPPPSLLMVLVVRMFTCARLVRTSLIHKLQQKCARVTTPVWMILRVHISTWYRGTGYRTQSIGYIGTSLNRTSRESFTQDFGHLRVTSTCAMAEECVSIRTRSEHIRSVWKHMKSRAHGCFEHIRCIRDILSGSAP